jgi:hypothetical protein
MTTAGMPPEFEHIMAQLARITEAPGFDVEEETPAALLFREFLPNIWQSCQDGLLAKTSLLRVKPEPGPAPRTFQFEVDCPYKRKLRPAEPVELMPGPVRGMIHYRADMFANPDLPYIAVQIDPTLGYFHPNCSRRRGSLLCLGEIPSSAFPFPLDRLLESHLYPIVTYQNRRPAHPFDEEAARYFALEPTAMEGLEPARALY